MIERHNFHFVKNDKGEWWLDLPEWQGDPEDLQMVEGADEWLELVSNGSDATSLILAVDAFDGAENLSLMRLRDKNLGGGGIYFLESYQQKGIHLKLWLCEVTEFVFGEIPQKIYFKVA